MHTANVLSIRSLDRGLAVLKLLLHRDGMSLRALHEASGVPKASLLRILKTLSEQRFVSRTADGVYFATVEKLALPVAAAESTGSQVQVHGNLLAVTREILHGLATCLPWPSDVGVRAGLQMHVMASNRASYGRPWRRSVVGERVDILESALGRSYLAFCSDADRREILDRAFAGNSLRQRRREAIEREIQVASIQGFAVRDPLYAGPDSHQDDRLSSIAVPILLGETPVACLSCVWDTGRANREEIIHSCLAKLVRVSSEVGAVMKMRH
jgi:IclR family mhp operon transcriptional activator